MGHWIPVTWLTFSVDYALWGMNASGYHFTNIVLHAVAAALVYFLSRRLLALGLPAASPRAITLGACAAALFFAVHPLRVESVVWVTERRDELSSLFYLLTVLAYLKACDASGARQTRWRVVSIGVYALGLLSKSTRCAARAGRGGRSCSRSSRISPSRSPPLWSRCSR